VDSVGKILPRGESARQFGLAILVGLGAGLGATFFRWLINTAKFLFFGGGEKALAPLGSYYVVLVPAVGGLLVGLLVYFFAKEAKGHGVPEVMLAVARQGGRIRPRVALVKSFASSICIGSGGSVGREGPIVQIGSAIGSSIGQWLRLGERRIKILVACGAAGGIAATFNAPIAGVFFALEVILAEFTAPSFGLVVLASVTATAISRAFLGDFPAFTVPPYSLVSFWEFLIYPILGLLSALLAAFFIRFLYKFEDIFDRWKIKDYLKPAAGGLLIGGIGFFFPQIFGVGYEAIESTLVGQISLHILILLIVVKVVATSLTIGSGGSGGVFAPSLFLGAMLGGAFGTLVHNWFPGVTASSGAYALVGMAAVFAGASRAPITAVIILFEMTGDYRIILPLMAAVVISTYISERFSRESIYTLKLLRRGIDLRRKPEQDLMNLILVSEAMTPDVETIPHDLPVHRLIQKFSSSDHHGFPVVDSEGNLIGIVTPKDVEAAIRNEEVARMVHDTEFLIRVGDIATTSPLVCYPDETLSDALTRFQEKGIGRLPVVERWNPKKLLGLLTRSDIISSYNKAAVQHKKLVGRMKVERPTDTRFVQLELQPNSILVGKKIRELKLPEDTILVSIRREEKTLIPSGNTTLKEGDRIIALTTLPQEENLRYFLSQ
jgi:CIC family chloride channel protein